jgi:hypothetical protein
MVVGFVLLSQLGVGASQLQVIGVMAVLGVGMGPLFGTITVALQNSVPSSEIGASTAALQFIRSLGGVVGLAAFAAVLTARLSGELEKRLPPGTVDAKRLLEPRASGLSAGAAAAARAALAAALDHVYLLCVPALVVAAAITWLLPELPLRTVAPHEEVTSDA